VIFGSINYLNLLPFQLFLKRTLPNDQTKQSFRYKKDVPSRINLAFKKRSVHAAFISSIASRGCRCTDLGIIADGPVYSVLVTPGTDEIDFESATSNALAQILGLHGKVMIGDKALRYFLSGKKGIDLSKEWKKQTDLPFVFARLCYNKYGQQIRSLAQLFAQQKIKIPQTILKKEAYKRDITPQQLLWYLEHIQYRMDHRSNASLKLFLQKSKKLRAR
jgi:chorismate dehydratase